MSDTPNSADSLQRFSFDNTNIRGELAHVNASYREVLKRHQYPTRIAKAVGELMAATALLSANLKFTGRLTLQIRLPGNISLQVELTELPEVYCNSSQIGQVVLNILVNAIQALEKDGGTIRISEVLANGVLSISIRDDGPGMDNAVAARVFEPFFTTKLEGDGTGLGLALCYKLMQEHQGGIELETAPGKGACFTLILPIGEKNHAE